MVSWCFKRYLLCSVSSLNRCPFPFVFYNRVFPIQNIYLLTLGWAGMRFRRHNNLKQKKKITVSRYCDCSCQMCYFEMSGFKRFFHWTQIVVFSSKPLCCVNRVRRLYCYFTLHTTTYCMLSGAAHATRAVWPKIFVVLKLWLIQIVVYLETGN